MSQKQKQGEYDFVAVVRLAKRWVKQEEEIFGLGAEQCRAAKILCKHFNLLRNEPIETQELYAGIFMNQEKEYFTVFIDDLSQENLLGRTIARHNLQVKGSLIHAGIDLDAWSSYPGIECEEVVEGAKAESDQLWFQLKSLLYALRDCFIGIPELYWSITKDAANIERSRDAIKKGSIPAPGETVFEVYMKTYEHLKRRGKGKELTKKLNVPLIAENFTAFDNSLKEFAQQGQRKKYSVRLWERDPLIDLFQGNNSNCCIAIGEADVYPDPSLRLYDVDYVKYPAGILEYLVDRGIQVAEVLEEDWGPVGSCWLFLSDNGEGGADLVVDSIDINGDQVLSRPQRKIVRSCIFRFLKNYARAIGAKRVLIGKTGPMKPDGERRKIGVDVEIDGLPVVSLAKPINKIGGYFFDKPYFLESRHGIEAFQVR